MWEIFSEGDEEPACVPGYLSEQADSCIHWHFSEAASILVAGEYEGVVEAPEPDNSQTR